MSVDLGQARRLRGLADATPHNLCLAKAALSLYGSASTFGRTIRPFCLRCCQARARTLSKHRQPRLQDEPSLAFEPQCS